MARLYLVRHAQASFGFDDYDKLSDLGIKQSTFIPNHFGVLPHALYRGDMLRHKQTVENSFKEKEHVVLNGFNEFDHENIFRVHRPEIADRDKAMAIIAAQENPKQFLESEFEKAMLSWINEEGNSAYKEPFRDFRERCVESLQQIISTARKEKQKEVVVITSGGYISFILTHVLKIPHANLLHFAPTVVNTSVTGFLFDDKRITLAYFNNYSHLPKELVTTM